ncbi:glycosyltransferase [bacterium]|nr:glycosyltransferase [bacterium]
MARGPATFAHEPQAQKRVIDSTLRVAYICARFPKLSEVFVARELEELRAQGVQAEVYSLLSGEQGGMSPEVPVQGRPSLTRMIGNHLRELASHPVGYLRALGIALSAIGGGPRELAEGVYLFAVSGSWAGAIRSSGVSRIHAHFAGAPTTAAWLVSTMTGLPFSFTSHANDIFVKPWALNAKIEYSTHVVTVTEYNRRHLAKLCPGAEGKLHVLPTGLPSDEMASASERSVEPGFVLAVGRLVPKKGFAALIEAFALLREKGTVARCVIVGDGPERHRLSALVKTLNLTDCVELLGARGNSEVADLLGRAAVFALPCRIAADGDRDGLPHSIMEAMAAGVPVVSTRVVGIPELVEDGVSGLLVEPDDGAALADAIERLVTDRQLAARLAAAGKVRVREVCDLTSIVARLKALFSTATLRSVGVAFLLGGLTVGPAMAAELFPDPDLKTPEKFLRPYSNFGKSDPVIGWKSRIEAGRAVVTGDQRQPAARVGVRTVPVPLGTGDYLAKIRVKGSGIRRLGLYAILVDASDNALATQELVGPAGDFDSEFAMGLTVQPEQAKVEARVILYVFHDGVGTFEVTHISIDDAIGAERKVAPRRDLKPIFQRLVLPGPLFSADFPSSNTALLPGERRFVDGAVSADGAELFTMSNREVALSWEMGVEAPTPFWLTPTESPAPGDHVVSRVTGIPSAGVEALPPLPAERGVYLFYYGAYRYGKKPRDLKKDAAALAKLREDGVTGIGFWDDYGLDLHRLQEGKALDGSYMVTMAEEYKKAGFTSPMLFWVLGGLERGRVAWTSGSEEEMRLYIEALKPWIAQAREKLGDIPLWVCPADEPDDTDRQALALKQATLWNSMMDGVPNFNTTNWQTARRLAGNTHLVLGSGSLPSFEEAAKLKVDMSYCSLDANLPPIRYRYLGGVYTWASGIPSQGYWHAESIAGKITSDLDGHLVDFVARENSGERLGVCYAQLLNGVEDLRLLCALEQKASSSGPHAAAIRAFLEGIRASVIPTDRLAAPWNDAAHYETVFGKGRELWRLASQSSGTNETNTTAQESAQ